MDVGNKNDYEKDTVARIIDLLKDTFGSKFITYFDGDPREIPVNALPCITVSEPDSTISAGATGTDDIIETVLIKVIFNKRDDMGADQNTNLTEWKQRKLVKGQHPTSGEYLPGTLMHAIRTNVTLTGVILEESIQTQSDVNLRPGELVTNEYWITITGRRRALVPARQ